MNSIEKFSATEKKFRPILTKINPLIASLIFSYGRKVFLNSLINSVQRIPSDFSYTSSQKLWDIDFGGNLFNAAGMFKYGKGYELCVSQRAAAYLSGTTTSLKRTGNFKMGVLHPFVAFPIAGGAVNWMGLPNDGHEIIARKLSNIEKIKGCPIGASVASSPEQTGLTALSDLLEGMKYYEIANVDFIELNESCPNVPHEVSDNFVNGLDKTLIDRLEFISINFLRKRKRNLPVIVKFSVDTNPAQLPDLICLIMDLGFDGINIGNTSTDYKAFSEYLNQSESKLFNFFTSNFGGGTSGRPLKHKSLTLASLAASYVASKNPVKEFNVIRTGGVENIEDLEDSDKRGIKLNQWFSGYFDAFSEFGNNLYSFAKSQE